MALTPRQKKFAAAYAGNATAAAKLAGYRGDAASLGQTGYRLLRNAEVRSIIAGREEGTLEALTLTREELQQMWSRMAGDETLDPAQRLKASELLGRSRAEFTDKHEVKGELTLLELVRESKGATKP